MITNFIWLIVVFIDNINIDGIVTYFSDNWPISNIFDILN